jgi:Fe-S-cluster containining protein
MSEEYRAVVAKVTAFCTEVEARQSSALACARGCSACCEAFLTVSPVEAEALRKAIAGLGEAAQKAVAARGLRELAREQRGEAGARCAMLEPNGSCATYDARPLVCRTQGHALLYPPGFVPEASVRQRTAKGDITHCPLNYSAEAPGARDVLDAGLVDKLLAVVNLRFAQAEGTAHDTRVAIAELAARAFVLASPATYD